jgi:transcriptional regulator with XRE-family HTH domain
MSVISKQFADELVEKRMRDAYLSAQTRTKLTNQIRAIRNQRGWSQGQFAEILGKPQSNVSRLENREYGSFTLKTLFELASAFDVGLVVEFVPYDDFLKRTQDMRPARLSVPSFSVDRLKPLSRDYPLAEERNLVVAVELKNAISNLSRVVGQLQEHVKQLQRNRSSYLVTTSHVAVHDVPKYGQIGKTITITAESPSATGTLTVNADSPMEWTAAAANFLAPSFGVNSKSLVALGG